MLDEMYVHSALHASLYGVEIWKVCSVVRILKMCCVVHVDGNLDASDSRSAEPLSAWLTQRKCVWAWLLRAVQCTPTV